MRFYNPPHQQFMGSCLARGTATNTDVALSCALDLFSRLLHAAQPQVTWKVGPRQIAARGQTVAGARTADQLECKPHRIAAGTE